MPLKCPGSSTPPASKTDGLEEGHARAWPQVEQVALRGFCDSLAFVTIVVHIKARTTTQIRLYIYVMKRDKGADNARRIGAHEVLG